MYAMAMAAGCCAAYSACATGQWLILPPCKTYEVCMYVVVQYVVVVVDVVGDGVAEAAIAGLFSAISTTTILWAIGHPDFVFRSFFYYYFCRATYILTYYTKQSCSGNGKRRAPISPKAARGTHQPEKRSYSHHSFTLGHTNLATWPLIVFKARYVLRTSNGDGDWSSRSGGKTKHLFDQCFDIQI